MTDFDHITIDELRRSGGLKWSRYPDAIGAWVAEMDFGVAPGVQDAVRRITEAGRYGYQSDGDVLDLAAATAEWHGDRFGWAPDPARVVRTPDVLHALETVVRYFTTPGSAIVVPTPAYMPFLTIPGYLGREVVEVPMIRDADGGYVLDLVGIEAALTAGGGLVLLCNPHNPTGIVHTSAELRALAEVVDRHPAARVFADEIHAPLVYAPAVHVPYPSVSAAAAKHGFVATSASKGWNLPGLKCAQLVLPDEASVAEEWLRVGFYASHAAAPIGVAANIAAYRDGREWLDGIVAYLDGTRHLVADLVAAHLPEATFRVPDGTYLAWIDVSAYGLSEDPVPALLEAAGVAVSGGAACGVAGRGHLRYNFATPRPIVERSFELLGSAITRLAGRAA